MMASLDIAPVMLQQLVMQRANRTMTSATGELTLCPGSLSPPVASVPSRMLGHMPPDVHQNVAGEEAGNNKHCEARSSHRIPGPEGDGDDAEDEVDEKIESEQVIGGPGEGARNRVSLLRDVASLG